MTGVHRPTLLGRSVPPAFGVRRIAIAPGAVRDTAAGEWGDDLVVVEHGTVEVTTASGARRSFGSGDLLCLDWVGTQRLANTGTDEARIVAISRPTGRPSTPPRPSNRTTQREDERTMKFRTPLLASGKNTTGFEIPAEVVESLGAGKRPPVRVTVNGYTYRNTVAVMDGVYMIGVSAEHRAASGLKAGDDLEVELELDDAPREVTVPADFAAALDADPEARRTFDGLSYSNRRFHVESVEGAKTDETRARRIAKSVAMLHEGRAR